MRSLLPLGCLALALAGAAHGQTPRLRFLDLPSSDRSLMGRISLRVGDDPFVRAGGRTVIRLDGALIAECYHLPCNLAWETDGIEDGRHLLQLVLVEVRDGRTIERILDERTITLRNGAKSRKPARADSTPPKPDSEIAPVRSQPGRSEPGRSDRRRDEPQTNEPGRDVPRAETPKSADLRPMKRSSETEVRAETPRPSAVPAARAPAAAPARELSDLNATALALAGRKLIVGLADGGVTIYDTADRKGTTVAGSPGAGQVRAVALAGDTVWWLTAPALSRPLSTRQGGAGVPAAVVGPQLCAYRLSDGNLETFDVTAVGSHFEPHQILGWGGRIALTNGSAGVVLDPKTGEFSDMTALLPRDVERARDRGALVRFASDGASLFAAAVEPGESGGDGVGTRIVRIWRTRNGDWIGGDARTAEAPGDVVTSVNLSPTGVTILTAAGVATVGLARGSQPAFVSLPASLPAPDSRTQAISCGPDAWWLRSGTLFHADTERRSADALFPWNSRGMVPRALAADKEGLWVATNIGVRRVSLDSPDAESGYGGFVRARLGNEMEEAIGPAEQKLAEAIESWQGTPYAWGGESRKGVDCSGFVMVAFRQAGVDLPHGSANLREYDMGQRVMDELRFGDVLVYPGHAAIYIGNGQTAETVSTGKKGVGKSTVWRRSDVVVRRFLNVALQPKTFASRGGKPPVPRDPKSSRTARRKNRS